MPRPRDELWQDRVARYEDDLDKPEIDRAAQAYESCYADKTHDDHEGRILLGRTHRKKGENWKGRTEMYVRGALFYTFFTGAADPEAEKIVDRMMASLDFD